MEYRIVWEDGSSARYSSLEKFLNAIHNEAPSEYEEGEFIVVIAKSNEVE